MYLRSVLETWWLLKAKNIRSLNAIYNIWKANYFCRSMGNATQIWVLLSSIAKTLHVLTTVPCNANASDSITPNDLRIWSNNFSFPHLFWESKLRTQDWTLAITQGGQEPRQALIWCLAFITHSVFRGGHMQASTCCDICLWKTEAILLSPDLVSVSTTLIQHLWTQRGKTEVHFLSFQGAGAIDPTRDITWFYGTLCASVSLSVSLSQPQMQALVLL